MVFTVSLGNEAVVVGVDDGRVEDAVDVEETGFLIEFVLDFRATGDFNNCGGERKRKAEGVR